MIDVKKKKIWMDSKHRKYVWVWLFRTRKLMQKYYSTVDDSLNANRVHGVCMGYVRLDYEDGKGTYIPETARVLLNFEDCGAGVVSHELGHAALNAWHHSPKRKTYPVIIKNMKDEEEILHSQTYAVRQFYRWYWKIEKSLK